MKNRSLKAGGRLNRWSFKAGFTVHFFFVRLCFSVENLEKRGKLMAWTGILLHWQWQSAEF